MTRPPKNIPFTPPPGRPGSGEQAGLPSWLYPAGFWVAVAALALGVLVPRLAVYAVGWMLLMPVLAAVWVAAAAWRPDRRLSVAALVALVGLGVVFFVKGLLG